MDKINIFELSYAGSPSSVRRYIESFMVKCEDCQDTGFITRAIFTEIDGRDFDYEITKLCRNCLD